MNVVVFGATGMVGKGVLLECLDDARVERVLLVSRHPIDISHPKLRDIVHKDFFDFAGIQSQFVDFDATTCLDRFILSFECCRGM